MEGRSSSDPPVPPDYPQFADSSRRFATFTAIWTCVTDIVYLVHLGLFQIESYGVVYLVCYCCGLRIRDWQPGDDPIYWLLQLSPDCVHMHNILHNDVIEAYESDFDPDIIGLANERPRSPASWQINLRYKEYNQRKESFKNWPVKFQNPRVLSQAGFYYTGVRDIVRCYHCDGGLRNWEPNDDPWIEHARYFPRCGHVLREKGLEFVQHVQQEMEDRHSGTHDNEAVVDQNEITDSSSVEDPTEQPIQFLCCHCQQVQPSILFFPCLHLVICSGCASHWRECPKCGSDITQRRNVYTAL